MSKPGDFWIDPSFGQVPAEVIDYRKALDTAKLARDEAQSQVRSLETDVRILRRERDEAVALLRRTWGYMTDDHQNPCADCMGSLACDCAPCSLRSYLERIGA